MTPNIHLWLKGEVVKRDKNGTTVTETMDNGAIITLEFIRKVPTTGIHSGQSCVCNHYKVINIQQ